MADSLINDALERMRMKLNYYCRKHTLLADVQWSETRSGVQDASAWTAKISVYGKVYGQGSGLTVGEAREMAAEQALETLLDAQRRSQRATQRATQDWRMEMNHYIQQNRLSNVQWTEARSGPQNAPTWVASLWINGVEYGRGSALNVGAAREIAAEQALRTLWGARH